MHRDIRDLEALTCDDIRPDRQSHYAHQRMLGAVVFFSTRLGQLRVRGIKTISVQNDALISRRNEFTLKTIATVMSKSEIVFPVSHI
jgi:hypothetical protein